MPKTDKTKKDPKHQDYENVFFKKWYGVATKRQLPLIKYLYHQGEEEQSVIKHTVRLVLT